MKKERQDAAICCDEFFVLWRNWLKADTLAQ